MYIHTIDISHPPLTPTIAEKVLDEEAGIVFSTQQWRVLKVIHGHGTDQRPSVLKQIVYNWAHRNRKRLLAIIPGEKYNIHDLKTQEMRKLCGQVTDVDLDVSNPGITLIWIK
ncbi:MAG: hypothetical protein ABR936_01945 [Bacteroidota bacterium]|jgi:hypothetical protein